MIAGGLRFVPERNCLVSSEPSILAMERKNFSYKRELRALFAQQAAQYGALGLDDGDREERDNNGLDEAFEAQMEGASKKQRKQAKMMQQKMKQAMDKNNAILGSKKYIFV